MRRLASLSRSKPLSHLCADLDHDTGWRPGIALISPANGSTQEALDALNLCQPPTHSTNLDVASSCTNSHTNASTFAIESIVWKERSVKGATDLPGTHVDCIEPKP